MNNNNKPVFIVIIVILAIVVVYLVATRNNGATNLSVDNKTVEQAPVTDKEVTKPNPMEAQIPVDLTDEQKGQLKTGVEAHEPKELTFNVTGGSFYFTPNEIRVKQGDKVKIVFTNVLGTHDFVLEAFNVRTKTIKDGESDTIEFIADKKGAFEYYCSVGKGYHRMKGQIGVLLVE